MAYIYTTHLPWTHHKQNENINKRKYMYRKNKEAKILELKNTVTDLKTNEGFNSRLPGRKKNQWAWRKII